MCPCMSCTSMAAPASAGLLFEEKPSWHCDAGCDAGSYLEVRACHTGIEGSREPEIPRRFVDTTGKASAPLT